MNSYNDNEYKSYFHTYKTIYDDDIDGLTMVSPNHKKYVSEKFLDDPIMCKVQRQRYIDSVNNWLLSPLYQAEYEQYDDEYHDEHEHEHEHEQYNDYDEDDEYDNTYDEYNDNEKNDTDYITNQTVGKKMYDEILNIVNSCDFEIDDHKQFKEDLIHFIYTLSNIN
jgi:ABC-type Zn2+ transport system substrate-binding protein/surface adhesin